MSRGSPAGPRAVPPASLAAAAAALLAAAIASGCGGSPGRPAAGGEAPVPPEAPAAPAPGAAGGVPAAGGPYAAAAIDGAGRISGRVVFKGAPRAPKPIEATKDRAVCGAVKHASEDLVVGPDGGLRNAVVSIGPILRGKPWPPDARPALDQRGCWFVPHVLVVPAGAAIDVVNSDGILHNIHTYPKHNPSVNLAQPKFKKVVTLSFARPDVVGVRCDVHSWMSAWIVVAAHPYHEVTDDRGGFALHDVPPGDYSLTAWHETLGSREQPVRVAPGGAAEATLAFEE